MSTFKPISNPVFALSTGRTGSTLVQRVLNCHPDLVVWGEHFGFLNSFGSAHGQMCKPDQQLFPKTIAENKAPQLLLPSLKNPGAAIEWANPLSLQEFERRVCNFMHNYFSSRLENHQRWGFKEIRYNNQETMSMLRAAYPQGKFIFIQRDPFEVTRSKVFAFIKENKWEKLKLEKQKQQIKTFLKDTIIHYNEYSIFTKKHPSVCLTVHYERLLLDPLSIIKEIIIHADLDESSYNWDLAKEVLGNIITSTKRDGDLIETIKEIANELQLTYEN